MTRADRKGFQNQAREFIRSYNPDILVFMETKIQSKREKIIIKNINYPNFVEIPLDGLSGGYGSYGKTL